MNSEERVYDLGGTLQSLRQNPSILVNVEIRGSEVEGIRSTGCFKESFTTMKAYVNLFRGYV
jgi:hypothetical protein